MIVEQKQIEIEGKFIRLARPAEEWYLDVDQPEDWVGRIRGKLPADIFTFWQRLPATSPRFNYPMEWESIAALPITTYDDWFKNKIDENARRAIRKSEKKGLILKRAGFDHSFIEGMTRVFNETPVRQGRRFPHYGKDHLTVEREFSRYLFREILVGAYYRGEVVGFVFLAKAGQYAVLGQIISMLAHRDKFPNNALIAKAVSVCIEENIPYLVYSLWGRGSLAEFKRRNGFKEIKLPRYYIPLNPLGKLALFLRLHRKASALLPERTLLNLIDLRSKMYSFYYRKRTAPGS